MHSHADRRVDKYSITDADSVRSVSEFLAEATIMHKFDHPNVLTLLGVVIEKNTPYVIMPLMKHGDLKGFIGERDRVRTMRQSCFGSLFI